MKSKPSYTRSEVEEIVRLIKEKLKAEPTKQKGIRDKIRKIGFYASDYGFRDGYTVEQFLSVAKINVAPSTAFTTASKENKSILTRTPIEASKPRSKSDESYVIDLCDEFLKQKALRQHRFDFLKGDAGTKLPVDAYYPSLNLVIEFKEKQHTEEVKFFDKRITANGKTRGEQRKDYDQLRRDVLPEHGISLIELDYSDFKHTSNKKLVRNREEDLKVVSKKLNN
jgi:hypothetical protein